MAIGQFAIMDRKKGKIFEKFSQEEAGEMMVGGLMDRADHLNQEERGQRFIPVRLKWKVFREYKNGALRKVAEFDTEEEAADYTIERAETYQHPDTGYKGTVKPVIDRVYGSY